MNSGQLDDGKPQVVAQRRGRNIVVSRSAKSTVAWSLAVHFPGGPSGEQSPRLCGEAHRDAFAEPSARRARLIRLRPEAAGAAAFRLVCFGFLASRWVLFWPVAITNSGWWIATARAAGEPVGGRPGRGHGFQRLASRESELVREGRSRRSARIVTRPSLAHTSRRTRRDCRGRIVRARSRRSSRPA